MMDSKSDLQARSRVEADFHDARISEADERRLSFAYVSVADVYRETRVPLACLGGTILEIGCFRGNEAATLSNFSGRYTGIDISPAAIEYCNGLNLPPNFRFSVDDANNLFAVPDGSVDYAFGNGVLHHLDLDLFASNFSMKLAPGGFGRFIEPAQGNFLLRAFRRMTPHLRTPDERPFDQDSFNTLEKHLSVQVSHHALLRPYVPMLFLNNKAVTELSRWLDTRLLRFGLFKRQAWLLCITLAAKHVDSSPDAVTGKAPAPTTEATL
jgi:SAM-dependent methyltransferase